jgi:Tfp pilus assembly protein PilO
MRPTLGRIVSERRAIVLPLLALALVNLALYALAVYPLSLRVQTLEARATAARDRLAAAERDYRAAQALVTGRERADAELKTFYHDVLPQDLAGARRMTYARLAELARESNLRYEHRTYKPDEGYEGDLEKLGIVMDLSGDYDDVRSFVHELETSPEFVVIEKMTLAEKNEGDPDLTLTLNLATFYRAVPHGD